MGNLALQLHKRLCMSVVTKTLSVLHNLLLIIGWSASFQSVNIKRILVFLFKDNTMMSLQLQGISLHIVMSHIISLHPIVCVPAAVRLDLEMEFLLLSLSQVLQMILTTHYTVYLSNL